MMMSPCSCSRLLLRDYCSRRRRFGVLQNIPTTTTTTTNGISPKNDSHHLSFFFGVDDDDDARRSKKRHTADSRRLLVGTTTPGEERDEEADVSPRCVVWSSSFLFSLSLSLSLSLSSKRVDDACRNKAAFVKCVGMLCEQKKTFFVSRESKK